MRSADGIRVSFRPLAGRRRALDLTQAELAKAAGLRRNSVWRIENGRSMPSVAHLVLIARALGSPMHQLMEIEEDR